VLPAFFRNRPGSVRVALATDGLFFGLGNGSFGGADFDRKRRCRFFSESAGECPGQIWQLTDFF